MDGVRIVWHLVDECLGEGSGRCVPTLLYQAAYFLNTVANRTLNS